MSPIEITLTLQYPSHLDEPVIAVALSQTIYALNAYEDVEVLSVSINEMVDP